jgi:hypothetical protein
LNHQHYSEVARLPGPVIDAIGTEFA